MSASNAPSYGGHSPSPRPASRANPHALSSDLGGTGIYCEHCGAELRDRWLLPESVQRIVEGLTAKALANRRNRGQAPECSVSMGRVRYRLSTIFNLMSSGTVSNSRAGRAQREAQKAAGSALAMTPKGDPHEH